MNFVQSRLWSPLGAASSTHRKGETHHCPLFFFFSSRLISYCLLLMPGWEKEWTVKCYEDVANGSQRLGRKGLSSAHHWRLHPHSPFTFLFISFLIGPAFVSLCFYLWGRANKKKWKKSRLSLSQLMTCHNKFLLSLSFYLWCGRSYELERQSLPHMLDDNDLTTITKEQILRNLLVVRSCQSQH